LKEVYFTSQNIEQKPREMLCCLEESLRLRKRSFHPTNSALLVLDMQDYFLDPSSHAWIPSAEAILPGIQDLIQAYYRNSLPVIFTQHIDSAAGEGMMPSWWRDTIQPENPLRKLDSRLDVSRGAVVQKSQYDAFHRTNLEEMLQDRGVGQVVICGVMTHLCCETTARSAFMRGFEVFFLVDGTATYNESFHLASLLNLAHGFATLVLVKEILAASKGGE
jgi:isochorismate hydrolase